MRPDNAIRCPLCGEHFAATEDMWERAERHQLRAHPETVVFANAPVSPRDPRIAEFTESIGRGAA